MNVPSQENVGLLSSDEGGGSSEPEESSEDEVTEHAPPPPAMAAARAQVPTISVTPHSPGVLDDSLQQLRRLHAAVQRMRAAPLPFLATSTSRLSTSCPSLCKDGVVEQDCASPTHLDFYPQSRKGSGESRQWGIWDRRDEGRRSSWAALEPGPRLHDTQKLRSALNGHSASLSSMESEGEVPRPVRHSTHSLNDSDLAKEFEKVGAALRAAATAGAGGARLAARLPLQKSVSTPSIVAAVTPQPPPPPNALSGGASETSDEESTTVAPPPRRNNAQDLGLHRLAFLEQAAYDHHAEKRRKRGSLFFRKKKDKARKAAHAWAAAGGGGLCDWCARDLADKPALYCENCTMTVHQNICKDYIVECNKPKSSKTSVGKSLSSGSGKGSKRSSVSGQSQNSTSTGHVYDDRDGSDHKHDQSNASDDAATSEWPEAYITPDQLGDEAISLGLGASEPDTWAAGAPKGLAKSLGERETKRQEHIYELILTEKHHCLTIRLMQKMFAAGMARAGVAGAQVARMFPRLDELWSLHAALLSRLRARQRAAPRVPSVADILAEAFAPPDHQRLKAAYGEFCSRHRDAVEVFKECCTREPRLARFIRKCQQNPLLRKKGVPECVLFVAQRLTKYPLLLEPLLKTAGDDVSERQLLQKALCGVKEILVDVDNQVAAKEREDRKLEIYHRIDAKSFANFRGKKFKKSDILQGNRSLKFEGVATLMQGRSKMQTLLVIVLSDVLFFLHDNNNKYTFFTPDNKTGVVSLSKLLVREKAGAEGRGLYLICSGPAEPEMFELRVHRPKDIAVWIHSVRAAVQNCPDETEDSEAGAPATSAEERQRQLEARHENIRLITEALRAKDREHAVLLEEKMALHMKMVGYTGAATLEVPHTGDPGGFPGGLVFPDYVRLAAPSADTHALWQEVCRVVKEALEAAGGGGAGGTLLGRSTSSAGERHSCAYESPALPRRADTFAGFDASRHKGVTVRNGSEAGDVTDGDGVATLRLQHAIYTLTCIVWQQLTTIHSLEAQVCAWRASGGAGAGAGWARAHEAQLEELRHAQARLTADRAAWEARRAADTDALDLERRQLKAARQELEEQQKDVEQQRERLYRRLERLQQHGGSQEEIASVGTLSPDSSVSDTNRRKEPKWRNSRGSTGSESSTSTGVRAALPPPQLLSAHNESRATARAPTIQQMVKQQLPLKLASGKGQQPPPGYHRLHESPSEGLQASAGGVAGAGGGSSHTRTGSSPAPLPSHMPAPPPNRATRTNTYPKLPDKFRVRSPDPPAPHVTPNTPNTPNTPQQEEEVIYF
ncbi:rho guanine nucleotide exchange factor 2 isoform X2 [Aricia agestis]|uniref:rho guanine nucleotide exchange factor 2 isoform X2 n=1 Tax=Aricia agestis TaxID=91739 RepID=UPI001C20BC39|nr:rho guanine nucleotide exchange factor 2 isoform X2 [Aricia agestis]